MKYILLICLLFIGCKKEDESYIVKDKFGNKHKYDINQSIDKDSTTIYCQLHYEWETIRHHYTKEGITYWMQTLKYFN
jgi:hypothetical protein